MGHMATRQSSSWVKVVRPAFRLSRIMPRVSQEINQMCHTFRCYNDLRLEAWLWQ